MKWRWIVFGFEKNNTSIRIVYPLLLSFYLSTVCVGKGWSFSWPYYDPWPCPYYHTYTAYKPKTNFLKKNVLICKRRITTKDICRWNLLFAIFVDYSKCRLGGVWSPEEEEKKYYPYSVCCCLHRFDITFSLQ